MKTLLAFVIFVAAAVAGAQEMPPIPKELDLVKFMTGKYKAAMTSTMMGQEEKGTGATAGKVALGGRYLEIDYSMTLKSMGTMTGKMMLGYNATKKQFYAYWMDSMGDGAMEFWGEMSGNVLTLVSKPFEMPNMPPMVMRATYTKVSEKRYDFKLEMQQGDTWAPVLAAEFSK